MTASPEQRGASLWVFGYGSLMWRPGFAFLSRHGATVDGHHRALCIYSHVHRGTPERPGLVLGLDEGGSCQGVAFEVAAADSDATLAYLRARELVTNVYLETHLPVRLEDGRMVSSVAYVVDTGHPQYAGRLAEAEVLALVRQGIGMSGPNDEYVLSTQAHLASLGIADPLLDWLADALARPTTPASR